MDATTESTAADERFIEELALEVAAAIDLTPRWEQLDAILNRYINGMVDAANKDGMCAIDFTSNSAHSTYRDTGLLLAFRVWSVQAGDFIINVEGLNLREAISERMANFEGDPQSSGDFIAALEAEVAHAKAIYAEHCGKPYEAMP